MKGLVCLIVVIFAANVALASPIYVWKERGGIVRFSSKTPPAGVKAEIFTSRGSTFSTIAGRGFRYAYAGGRLRRELYRDLIRKAAGEFQVDPALVQAIIHVESAFNARAVSPKGAQGLMQLMPDTARMHGVARPFEPSENIMAGTRHMAMLLKKYDGNITLALAAYNAGEEAVREYNGIPPYAETREYVRRVQALRDRYSRIG